MNAEDELPDPDLKIILLGDSACGKSKLVERFLMDEYNPRQMSTYALTLFRKEVRMEDGEKLTIDFWDTAGQETFSKMHPSYYYRAHCCIMVFDVTRKVTYQHLNDWYAEFREYCQDVPCILVANKVDVDYNVTKKEFKFASKNKLPFFFVSAAPRTGVKSPRIRCHARMWVQRNWRSVMCCDVLADGIFLGDCRRCVCVAAPVMPFGATDTPRRTGRGW